MMTTDRPKTLRRPLFIAAGVFFLLGFLFLMLDLPIARACLDKSAVPGDVVKGLNITEAFAHGVGVFWIFVAVWSLDPTRWRAALPIGGCAYGAGLFCNISKVLVIARFRPHSLPEGFDFSGSVWSTFDNWFPLVTTGTTANVFESGRMSFPSSHSATAMALAAALAIQYPRGRYVFFLLALTAMVQRVVSGAHYASDTCWGAAIGLAFVAIFSSLMRRCCAGPSASSV